MFFLIYILNSRSKQLFSSEVHAFFRMKKIVSSQWIPILHFVWLIIFYVQHNWGCDAKLSIVEIFAFSIEIIVQWMTIIQTTSSDWVQHLPHPVLAHCSQLFCYHQYLFKLSVIALSLRLFFLSFFLSLSLALTPLVERQIYLSCLYLDTL